MMDDPYTLRECVVIMEEEFYVRQYQKENIKEVTQHEGGVHCSLSAKCSLVRGLQQLFGGRDHTTVLRGESRIE